MSKSSIPQAVMHLCRTCGVHELGKGGKLKPWGGLGHRETRKPSLTATPRWSPPLPSWLPDGGRRGMGRVIPRPSRRGWTGPPPRLRVPPLVSAPHHGEVTRPWAAVGVSHHIT